MFDAIIAELFDLIIHVMEMVEILNQYFGSVFTHEETSSLPDCASTESNAFIQDLEFNEALIKSYIKNLKNDF